MVSASSYPAPLGGRFRIDAELARGGMGAVFAAVDASTGSRVALKRLTPGARSRAAMLFEREFHVLSSLKHPRIIEVYDYGVDAEGPYYTMELLEGADLRELSPLPPLEACRYLRDVASSLALLHARRLLHRDVSPRNVRTLPGGGCKLIDFGALMSFGTSDELVGTPPAIPPEALSGEPMDQRADLFALGALAYFVLTGRHAYPARKVQDLAEVWQERIVPPSRRAPDVSPELDKLVLSLLSLDVLGRPLNAGEVIDRLNGIAGLPSEGDEHAAKAYFVGAALVERGPELERVARRLARAKTARGTVVFVDGEPGVGKTRFLNEAALKAQLSGATVLRADAAARSERLSTMRALVSQLVRLVPHVAKRVLAAHASRLSTLWPELLADLDVEAPEGEEASAPGAPDHALAALPRILEDVLLDVARRNTLVVAVDNVDSADPASAALLLGLGRAARTERVLVLVTASVRPGVELPAAVRALRDAGTSIRLRDLTENGAVQLVRTAFGDVPHVRRTAMRLYTATHGNPEHAMRLLQRWVGSDVVHYAGGAWNLPLEIPADDESAPERTTCDRLRGCSPTAKRLAAALAVVARPTPLEPCAALSHPNGSKRDVIAALEELLLADVVVLGHEGYRFVQEAFRAALLRDLDGDLLRELEQRAGEVLLAAAGVVPEQRMTAGFHLIRGGDEARGAELVARTARAASEEKEHARLFARHAAALEAALDVYRKSGRSRVARLDLLVPLVLAGSELSPAFGARYAGETIDALERALGLLRSDGTRPGIDAEELRAALRSAPVLDDAEERTDETPDAMTLLTWLIRSVVCLVASASSLIDPDAQTRYAEALRPFTALGADHPAAVAYEYCCLVRSMSHECLARSHAGWTDIHRRICTIDLPPIVQRRFYVGSLYALGILECQRDDDSALARVTQIEQLGTAQSTAMANQLRFLYHGLRGERGLAQEYRDRVEAHAVQQGSGWQLEIWSTCTLAAVYNCTRDIAGSKRVLEALARLKKDYPSLEEFWERAVATQYWLTGAYARAVETYERQLARPGARERVGWASVQGGLARAYNSLEKHDLALRVCEETVPLSEENDDYVATMLGIRIEHCRALAGLGQAARAKELLCALFERYAPNKNPTTLGAIHRTFAEIAQREGDTEAFERHLAEMRALYLPTKNPALIAQCDSLRNAAASATGFKEVRTVGAFATQLTLAQSVLASCEGAVARKQRALELVAAQTGIQEAFLFTRGDDGAPKVIAQLGLEGVSAELGLLVDSLFDESLDDANETAFVESSGKFQVVPPPSANGFRLLPLTVHQGGKRLLVGAIAVPAAGQVRSVSHDLLEDMAAQLFQAGDVATVRLLG